MPSQPGQPPSRDHTPRDPQPDATPPSDGPTDANRYYVNSSAPTIAQELDRLAKELKPASSRLLLHFVALTETRPHHAITITTRELCAGTKLARSALIRALKDLAERGYLTIRHGGNNTTSSYLVNFFSPLRGSFGEPLVLPDRGSPIEPRNPVAVLFEDSRGSFGEPPPTQTKTLTARGRALDLDFDSQMWKSVINRVLNATDPGENAAEARDHLQAYMRERGTALAKAQTLSLKILAEFLDIATWPKLRDTLKQLAREGQRPEIGYAWFVAVALQRIHGIPPEALKQARAEQRQDARREQRHAHQAVIAELARKKAMP